ncbi:transmembrane emp24 domain-containing protein 7-like isoform X1 [Gigantopelta aegis]|uniref:transmembrane emp24 domain-containing protein 7-like isoform X1 n=1 Tax=Gigantopelta aegis TaxID=1735272 RepID=UPI001B88AC75|nr:transmembrane emp24 domain-containing protein 7-like isoform X1 [Gigantopelta aegis]
MDNSLHIFLFLTVYFLSIEATELTFELPDNEKQCFFEKIDKGIKSTLEFQVITGGQYDVDMELVAPNGQILYKDVKKQYDSFTWTADQTGVYKFCFSNEFSTFSHKVVYFDLEVGDEKPIVDEMEGNAHATAMTMMESGCVNIHESLRFIADGQTHYRLREAQGRVFAKHLRSGVMYWSIGQTAIILLVSIGQVFVLRGFFADKKTIKPSTTVLS